MRLAGTFVVMACTLCPALAEEPAKPKAAPTLKDDAERIVGVWQKPPRQGKNPLGMVVTTITQFRFAADGTGTLTEDISIVEKPFVADFKFKADERDGKRVLVVSGKAFGKEEVVVPYRLEGDKLTLEAGEGTLTNPEAGIPAVAVGFQGEWTRILDQKERARRLEKWQGTWKMVEIVNSGRKIPEDELKNDRWTFKGDELTIRDNVKKAVAVAIDPSRKPAPIDLLYPKGPVVGIYQFDDEDTLRIRLVPWDKPRPKNFDPPETGEGLLYVLKREKK